eukprot:c21479_g1_i1.p1 GENE.c21479_g1_i1~~c21479_g1_i1.p1  ORF type:complete len:388 (-),score=194.03 c21479_g1_i1:39-1202(-)
MKTSVIFFCLVLAFTRAETENAQIDPAIPRDKCGLSIGINENDRTEVFILGTDKSFYHKYETEENSWSSWISLGGSFKGGPTVVRSNDGRLEVFGRGADNAIWHKYQIEPNSFQWSQWMSLGSKNKFSSNPVAILSSEGFIHVFAKGIDGSLMHKTQFTNNTLFVWTEWTSLGGSLTSQPAVMLDAEALLHVFVRGPDRALWHKYQIGGQEPRFVKWSEWQSLGGVLASAPRVPVALNTVNLLEIFARASDKAIWHRCQVASLPSNEREVDWNEWQSLGGVFSSGPSAVVNGDGLIDVFGRGADKAIWRKSQSLVNGVPKWNSWVSLHGITSTGPVVRVRSDGLVDVYTRGVDKQIWSKGQALTGNSTEFGTWKSLDGTVLAESFAC